MIKLSVEELIKKYGLGERNFENIDLIGANLQETQLQEINLSGSNLQGAILININWQQAILDRVNLSDASLMGANLNGASLMEATLDRANLANANLNEASLVGASLLDGTYLRGASLIDTLLNNAQLNDAIFSKANLQGTHLNGACLKGAVLGDADLKGAYYNDSTQFSSNFDPSQAGAIEVLSESHTVTITISQLLDVFNPAFQASCKYLGNKISIKYLENTKPNYEWLNRFEVDRNNKIVYSGSLQEAITEENLEFLQLWFNDFQSHCCQIIPGFGKLIK